MKGQEKIKVRHKGNEYEGVPAPNASGMALFGSAGMRRLIDRRCRYGPGEKILSPGSAVKALIGPAFNVTKKFPPYPVGKAYNTAPADRLFGEEIVKDGL